MLDYENINNTHDLINAICDGKGEFLEIHNLRSYAPVLLNRDGNGEAKTAIIGGSVRTIVSSQCRKAAIRHNALNSRSERTRYAPERVAYYMKEQHPELTEEYLEGVMDAICNLLGENKKKGSIPHTTSTVITIGKEDIERISSAIEKQFGLDKIPQKNEKEKKENEKAIKELGNFLKKSIDAYKLDYDVCLFGRMSTNQIIDTVDSASFFGFSFGVNENAGDNDSFIAQDTFDKQCAIFETEHNNVGNGAGHLDDRTISADTFYEYCGFSIPAYLENVMKGVDYKDKEAIKERVKHAFEYLFEILKLCVVQVPTAMQHQMSSFNRPVSFVTLTQDAQNITYGDAFERKVVANDDESVMDIAVKRLVEAANDDTFFYGQYIKKYWLSKQYSDEAKIEDVKKCTLNEMLESLKVYFYGKAGI